MSDGKCRICGKSIKNNARGANKQHAGKHCRDFADETGFSKHTDYDLIVAYYKPENAPKWAREIMAAMKEADAIPRHMTLNEAVRNDGE